MPLTNSGNETPKSSRTNPTTVPASRTSVQLLAANATRKGATIWNNASTNLYVELGAAATLSAFTVIITSGSYYEIPYDFTGLVSGIWSNADGGVALVREFI